MGQVLGAGDIGRLPAAPTAGVGLIDSVPVRSGNNIYEATLTQVRSAGGLGTVVANVTLTSAQILALNATPITVLAAPGAGLVNVIKRVYATKAAGTAYAGIAAGEDIAFKYTDASGSIGATLEMTGFADSASATQGACVGTETGTLPVANAVIVAHMLTGEIITGTSDFKLRIEYQTLPVPAF